MTVLLQKHTRVREPFNINSGGIQYTVTDAEVPLIHFQIHMATLKKLLYIKFVEVCGWYLYLEYL